MEWAVSIVMVFLLIAMLNEESSAWFDQRKLELMASQDRLTRLPNLRSFMRIAENTLKEQPIAILMLDIDDFKNYNDRLGHLQGDQLLQEAGAVLRSAAGEKDYVARYGGEEFIVMSSGCDDISMAVLAGKLCRTVSDYPFPKREVQPDGRITISVGAAAAKQPKEDLRRLIAQADEALYYSKHTGKSKYTIYEDTLPAVMKGHGSRIPGA
ncbi:GGDEF domain-containing protein [Paenibacillus sp. CC-CFT747]|nr:GGDEF domain-containing protein [Paenibacillus sp. CC-CFT747]